MSFSENLRSVFEFAKDVSFHPKTATTQSSTTKELVIFASVMILLYSVGYTLTTSILQSLIPDITYGSLLGYNGLSLESILLLIPVNFISSIIGLFVGVSILHGLNKIFRIYKKPIGNTFTAYVYSFSPMGLIGWIPFVGLISGIWSFIVSIYAISNQQEISAGKSLLSLFLPGIIIIVVIMVFAFVAVFSSPLF